LKTFAIILSLIGTLAFAGRAAAQSSPIPARPPAPAWIGDLSRSVPGVIRPGDVLVGRVKNVVASDVSVACGGKPVDNLQIVPDPASAEVNSIQFNLAQIDPGFASCILRSAGVVTSTHNFLVMDANGTLTGRLPGRALYQKVEVTDHGLDIERTSMLPIRNARIEVFDPNSRQVISVSDSGSNGEFEVAVPPEATDLVIRAVSRLYWFDLRVEDNTNVNQFYYIFSADIDMREPPASVQLVDATRRSGAFNILEQIQRANDFVQAADPLFAPIPFTIFWSERNQKKFGNPKDGLVGTTHFSLTDSTAYVLGDRNTDSDEFDDSVLIHEYAHMLATKFSRDDSIGGWHQLGDNLDPRVAWSEGWANFFSAAVRNDSIYRDSKGPGGVNVMRFDVEENYPPASSIGYGSETSVQALLWDFYDDKSEPGDSAQFDFAQIWAAFTDLRSNRFVYLPYFLDHLIARNPSHTDAIQQMALAQAIYFQPGIIPSVTNPFPMSIAINSTRIGEVDSLSTRRTNLAQSANFFVFSTNGGPVAIQLLVGPGTVSAPGANDLDLYLYNSDGRALIKSNSGQSGQGERIPYVLLSAGTYVIEVRSYFTRAGNTVFNSGSYSLSLFGQ
jgi:hypothetical protein